MYIVQIRLSDGTATVQSFNATDTLQDVLTRLGSHNTRLMTTFPKRIFSNEDKGKTLKDLGKNKNINLFCLVIML